MKTYRYSLLLVAIFFTVAARAQDRPVRLELSYTAGIPSSNLRNLVDQTSWRGVEGALMFDINQKLALGIQSGYQDFYQKYPRAVYNENGSDLSAVVTNSIQTTPILLKAKYRFGSAGKVQPFASLAAGGNLISYRKYYGQFVDSRSSFRFAGQPELGVNIPLGASGRSAFHLAAGYNFMPFKYNDADGLSHGVIKAGFSFSLK
ncbi:MAG TPA: outer membrane beta-barrel protein [Flavisolibacter sp.]|nr:outer membrane beta-barrel protein [Flavisolibacter sp.]